MREIKLYINGEFVTSGDNRNYTSLNSANMEPIAKVHLPSEADLEKAINAAEAAFYSDNWRAMNKDQRADILLAISEKIKERKNELIELEVKDSGSTIRKAKADIHNASSYFKVLSKQLRSFEFEQMDQAATTAGFSKNARLYEPIGVCAQIIPWNFPLVMAAWKIGPIIATGCTTVLKSAQETPVTASILAEIIHEVGVPAGVVNIVTGGEFEGKFLVNHPKVRKVAFTGSTEVGRYIMQQASGSLKTLSLELGGKSANIVLDDADLDMAVDGSLYAFLYHSGQACDSGTRLLVQAGIYDQFIQRFKERISQIKIGVPEDPTTSLGPVINEKQFNRIMNFIQETKNEDAPLIYGGERAVGGPLDKGYYIKPTEFEITPDNRIFNEEIFGTVVVITNFKTIDD
jgi:aldehyde dehydrogenase (NAD+)